MITVNAIGDACPLPVVKTIKAIKEMQGSDTIETLVDNTTAVENLRRLANSKGYAFTSEKQDDGTYRVLLNVEDSDLISEDEASRFCDIPSKKRTVVEISSDCMGSGDDKLGAALMKSFIFALLQLEDLPDTVLFFNGGAKLSCEGSDSLDDIRELEKKGVEILTCGTCLNFYGLTEKLGAGSVTNMYSIVETLNNADLIIRP